LGGIAGIQSQSINSLQDQIILNSDLNRSTNEKMLDAMETKGERKEQEFNDKIQNLQQEMQELKSKQTSTLLPQNQTSSPNLIPGQQLNQNLKEFNPQIPYQISPNIPQKPGQKIPLRE
jgi:hypothetical protein